MSRRRAAPAPPAGLSVASQAIWGGLASDVAVSLGGATSDYLQLEDLLRTRDRLDEVRAILAVEGLLVLGSKAQPRPNPMLGVEAGLQRAVAAGYGRLGLDSKSRGALHVRVDGRLARGNVGGW